MTIWGISAPEKAYGLHGNFSLAISFCLIFSILAKDGTLFSLKSKHDLYFKVLFSQLTLSSFNMQNVVILRF